MNEQHADLVIADVQIFDGDNFINKGYVRCAGGRILQLAAGEYTHDDGTATVVRSPGDTLLPGLIDSHVHSLKGNVQSVEQSLRFGVTTVCDMHNDPRDNAKLRTVCPFKTSLSLRQNTAHRVTIRSCLVIRRTSRDTPTSSVLVWVQS